MQILPSRELMPFIKHYLFLDIKEKGIKKLRLFSDGNTGIVFSSRRTLLENNNDAQALNYLPKSFLYGQINDFKDIFSVDEVSLAIIVFQSYGINQLLRIPAGELYNKIVPVEDIFGSRGIETQDKFSENTTIENKIHVLNLFLKELIIQNSVSDPLIIPSLDFILKTKGVFSMKQLVKFTGYSERHIERKFTECIGLSPRNFGNIIRLHGYLKRLKNDYRNLTEISYESGYADQSHLIKEFRKYTGITPRQYIYDVDKIASNFICIPDAL